MKLVLFMFAIYAAAADRLDNIYLPPSGAKAAGGGSFLGPPGSSYVPPASGPVPAQTAPSARTYSVGTPVAAILRFNNDNAGDGTYRFEYETENRISQQESGQLSANQANVVQGSYSYAAPDGVTYTVNYVADENGFRANGAHLPTPPPIPDAIQRSLEINAASTRSGYSAATDSFTTSFPSRQYLTPQSFPKQPGYRY